MTAITVNKPEVSAEKFLVEPSDPLCLGDELASTYPFTEEDKRWVEAMDIEVSGIMDTEGWALPKDLTVYSYQGEQESAGLDGSLAVCEPARNWWVSQVGEEFGVWASNLPDPRCLEAVYNPSEGYEVNSLMTVREGMARLMRYHPLAIATRQRAALQNREVREALERDSNASMLNLGCGTDATIYSEVEKILGDRNDNKHVDDIKPSVGLVDISGKALSRSQALAGEVLGEHVDELAIETTKLNMLHLPDFKEFCERNEGLHDLVTATGFTEYVGGSAETLLGGDEVTSLEEFLKGSYRMLKPGGRLVVSQALIDSPHKNTLFGALGWSAFVCRDIEGFTDSVVGAGIDTSTARVILTDPHLHAIFVIEKPEE
jgi:SAM-dependent methyltransferase